MRSVWTCSTCVAALLGGLLGLGTEAANAGPKRDLVHRVPKAQITPGPLLQRAASTCKTDYSQCPDSVGGGCCPSNYECATDSCFATTVGVTSACGKEGWFACGLENSGGCCPVGYVCGPQDCTAPASVTTQATTCPFNYSLCPASLNYGCCPNGMGCALNACYSTSPITTTVVQIVTATSGGQTITTTQTAVTVATPTPPSGLPTDRNVAPKFIPTSVPKISPTTVPDENNNRGLTTAQLGGVVGGVVALLVIVIVASFIIIRRLNRVAAAVESKSTSHSKSHSQSQTQQYGHHYVEDPTKDPFLTTPNTNTNTNSAAGTPPIGGVGYPTGRDRSNSGNFTSSTVAFSPDTNGPRHPSMDSGQGYFDLPPRVHNLPGGRQPMTAAPIRSSVDSHSTQGYPAYVYQHQRQQSNASELSDGSEGQQVTGPFAIPELDSSGAFHELPSDGLASSSSLSQNHHGRSRSNSGVAASPRPSLGNSRRRSESGSGPRGEVSPSTAPGAGATSLAAGFGPLDVVNESAEIMHGYYGPRDRQVGQTAAGLADVHGDVSSPVSAGAPQVAPLDMEPQQH